MSIHKYYIRFSHILNHSEDSWRCCPLPLTLAAETDAAEKVHQGIHKVALGSLNASQKFRGYADTRVFRAISREFFTQQHPPVMWDKGGGPHRFRDVLWRHHSCFLRWPRIGVTHLWVLDESFKVCSPTNDMWHTCNDNIEYHILLCGGLQGEGEAMGDDGGSVAFAPIGFPGWAWGPLHVNMYTAPAWFACLICIISLVLLIILLEENYAGIQEKGGDDYTPLPKFDVFAVSVCVVTQFTLMFIITNLET
ncbi:hypothetical protein ANCCEY_08425 [Ancylostoma ceylanicum]|uniref:Uncharacterized protein n=1 Tax=Ancylostoma ceylanicum TaxID=53326 RepID=A0A0D6LKJ5_9BILA|nr:hypothetical protein ANCCEY_08425 [Ancylostoma ceylanicum]